MSGNVTRLTYQDKEIILVGTAHVSQDSVDLVRQVIEEERPDSVCIELDEKRYENLQNPKKWEDTDIIQVIKSGRVGFLLANVALSSYQKKMADKLETTVGGEMLQGMESARETGVQLVLADRDLQTTFLRIWRKLGAWEKVKMLASLLFSDEEDDEIDAETIQEMLQSDVLNSMMADVRKEFPKIGDILIGERDQYLSQKIKNAPGPKVVAILGAAHVPGVVENIYKDIDMREIGTIPPKKKSAKAVGWIIPLMIVGLIVYAFVINIETGMQQLSSWVLWNGTLAALFSLLCMAHPLSILTAFVAAPITSLNPLLACGWFAGLVQATIQKPTVQDAYNIQTDIFSLKGFFKNRLLKALLLVIMANIGSTIGTFIAGTDILTNLLG